MRHIRATVSVSLVVLAVSSIVVCHQNMAQSTSPRPNRDINVVLAAHDKELLAIADVVGVYAGTMQDSETLFLRVMLARKNPESVRKIPRMIDGYPVVIQVTGAIRAFDSPVAIAKSWPL